MKCLETENLIRYAYRLIDEPAALQVRAHLRECPRCREIVEEHAGLDSLLSEWKVVDPTPGFDARVRQAVEARLAQRAGSSFWGGQWTRGLALASLAILVIAGVVLLMHGPRWFSPSPQVVKQQPPPSPGVHTPPQTANLHPLAVPAHTAKRSAHVVPEAQRVGVIVSDEKVAQALEDYDLAANFDLLSELPKGEPRVVN
jgi:hypothetical protein